MIVKPSRIVVEVLEASELVGRIFLEQNAVQVLVPNLIQKLAPAQEQGQQREWRLTMMRERWARLSEGSLTQVQVKRARQL